MKTFMCKDESVDSVNPPEDEEDEEVIQEATSSSDAAGASNSSASSSSAVVGALAGALNSSASSSSAMAGALNSSTSSSSAAAGVSAPAKKQKKRKKQNEQTMSMPFWHLWCHRMGQHAGSLIKPYNIHVGMLTVMKRDVFPEEEFLLVTKHAASSFVCLNWFSRSRKEGAGRFEGTYQGLFSLSKTYSRNFSTLAPFKWCPLWILTNVLFFAIVA
uniref:Uncharacterized protein n=1 Tax=Chromera velia CCMP2878 TaxID=1169474 RepID=A0A0G4EZZ5_9ALVE|eukprot:Cvel_2536.t1-p1 / transcript=Cvel_2536.t1 / gene=Cvel_2536 / organism=Chromera_velia_CCMP2878 / gene_product=hypothetical protein / transcript_product=hypothetical protein / location=Cvel_scaffold100:52209-53073(+) / protein_length=215 / sequence_SO=supercontig / SO=protein_coding / is_pseudo=false